MAINIIKSYVNYQIPKDVALYSFKETLEKIENNNHLIKRIMQVDLESLQKDPNYKTDRKDT